MQHATVATVKGLKNALKDDEEEPALKSYYIKTAVLWLAQDQPSDHWTGITAGVNMVLDWLERHLSVGNIPCFFWPLINLMAGLEAVKLQDMMYTVHLMRSQMNNRLLMACCRETAYDLDIILEEGEPLSESELRVRVARRLVWCAVMSGIIHRSTAPCWEDWFRCFIPALGCLSQHRLLQWLYHHKSGTYQQQCYLLQALAVAPADLVAGMRLTSLGGDMYTWPVTPLLNLLTESDLRRLLGDPAAVAAWCRQQLSRPPAERPAGLTAELNTPRGRAELLLQPELYLRAVSETVPALRDWWQRKDQETAKPSRIASEQQITYQKWLLEANLNTFLMEMRLSGCLPELDGPTVAITACLWRQNIQHLLSGDRLREAFTAAIARWPDRLAALSVPGDGRHQ